MTDLQSHKKKKKAHKRNFFGKIELLFVDK